MTIHVAEWKLDLQDQLKAYACVFIGTDLRKIEFDDIVIVNIFPNADSTEMGIRVADQYRTSFSDDMCEIKVDTVPRDISWDGIGVSLKIWYSAIGETEAFTGGKGTIDAFVYYDSNGKIMDKVIVMDTFLRGSKSQREHYQHFSDQLLLQILEK